MEGPEVPLEEVHEHIQHHAEHEKSPFVSMVALSTAIIAAIAAISALLAGHHANEAMILQIQSSDQWAFYQAKSIKAAVLSTKIALLEGQGKEASEKDKEKLNEYGGEQEEIKKEAEAKGAESKEHLERHEMLASGVTLLQIAIAVGAISALTKRKPFWVVSLVFGLGGVYFLVLELLRNVHHG
jgi:hypothetical protein